MRNRLLALLAAATMVLSIALAAEAAETEATVDGKGFIRARGTGTAILDGHGRVQMAIDGDVVIDDLAGDARVKIAAVPAEESDAAGAQFAEVSPTRTYTFDNFRGRLQVVGSDFRIEAEGTMRFRGHGEGTVELDGRGVWKTRHRRGTWNGVELRFGGTEVGES